MDGRTDGRDATLNAVPKKGRIMTMLALLDLSASTMTFYYTGCSRPYVSLAPLSTVCGHS